MTLSESWDLVLTEASAMLGFFITWINKVSFCQGQFELDFILLITSCPNFQYFINAIWSSIRQHQYVFIIKYLYNHDIHMVGISILNRNFLLIYAIHRFQCLWFLRCDLYSNILISTWELIRRKFENYWFKEQKNCYYLAHQ